MTDLGLPETRYARSGDISIAYQTMGHGPLDFVIVGGQISHVEFDHELPGYTAFVQRLSKFARVVTFDKRGQGLSDRTSSVASLEERMDDVRAVMDAIGSRRAVLGGFSDGCAMSILFAATYPERVSHLVLVGGYVRAGHTISDEAFEASVTSRIAAWGTGQSMKRVVGTRDENEREIALLGKYERLVLQSRRLQDAFVDEPSYRRKVDPAQRADSHARAT